MTWLLQQFDKFLRLARRISEHKYFTYGMMALFLLMLAATLRMALILHWIDADTARSALLWKGIQQYGLGFVKTWQYTPDNWLIIPSSFHFFLFALFGTKPIVIVIAGWLILAASAVMLGVILQQLDARKAALMMPTLALCFGRYLMMTGGALHPLTHSSSNLCGLIALWCFIGWGKEWRARWLIAFAVIVFAAGISDPWFVAAYLLPFLLASLLLYQRYALMLFINIALLAAIKTRGFGALDFFVLFHFALADWTTFNSNALYFVRDMGALLNIVPGVRGVFFLPAAMSLLALLVLALLALVQWRPVENPYKAAYWVAMLSIGGTAVAFIIFGTAQNDLSGRFLINIVYMGILALSLLAEKEWARLTTAYRALLLLIAGLFAFSGVVSNRDLILHHYFDEAWLANQELIAFLSRQKLTYGYGPYWGSNANAISWMSGGEVIIRPVMFDRDDGHMITGIRAESSPLWFTPQDMPNHQAEVFVMVKNDGEECPDIMLCIHGLKKQFGMPARTIFYQGATILIWPKPLAFKQ